MNLHDHNLMQIKEALGNTNRYFYWLATGRNSEEASDNELIMFYISQKGAEHFRSEHKEDM